LRLLPGPFERRASPPACTSSQDAPAAHTSQIADPDETASVVEPRSNIKERAPSCCASLESSALNGSKGTKARVLPSASQERAPPHEDQPIHCSCDSGEDEHDHSVKDAPPETQIPRRAK
jgi:hypothetical protein